MDIRNDNMNISMSNLENTHELNYENYSKDSIIIYAKEQLGAEVWSMLRMPPYVLAFLNLILSDECRSIFSIEQYHFAANLVYGRKIEMRDEDTLQYLYKVREAYERYYCNETWDDFNSKHALIDK